LYLFYTCLLAIQAKRVVFLAASARVCVCVYATYLHKKTEKVLLKN